MGILDIGKKVGSFFVDKVANFGAGTLLASAVDWAADQISNELPDQKINTASPTEKIPLIYGEVTVGANNVYANTSDGGSNLHQIYTICEGEISEIVSVFLAEKDSSTYPSDRLILTKYVGAPLQVANAGFVAELGDFTTDFTYDNIAYVATRFRYDTDVWSGVPQLKIRVKGKLVYDPRNSTTGYSTNPILCILDFLTNPIYGFGIPLSDFNLTSFSDAANVCDTIVTGGRKLFEINKKINIGTSKDDILKNLLASCRASMSSTTSTQTSVIIDLDILPTYTFTNPTYELLTTKSSEIYNQAEISYITVEGERETVTYKNAAFLATDGNRPQTLTAALNWDTNRSRALDFGAHNVIKSRSKFALTITTEMPAYFNQISDVVNVTIDDLGFINRLFKIENITLTSDLLVNITLREHSPAAYIISAWPSGYTPPPIILPDPFFVAPVITLVVNSATYFLTNGERFGQLDVSWTKPSDTRIVRYEVQYKNNLSATWLDSGVTADNQWVIQAIEAGSYDVRVRAINMNSAGSAYTTSLNNAFAFAVDNGKIVPSVSGLGLRYGGTTFKSRSIEWRWDARNLDNLIITGGNATQGNDAAVFYRVQVLTGATVIYEEIVTEPKLNFNIDQSSEAKNFISSGSDTTPYRELTIRVWVRDSYGRLSPSFASHTATNPLPNVSEFIWNTTVGFRRVTVDISQHPLDNDYLRSEVHVSTTTNFVPNSSTYVGEILSNQNSFPIDFLPNGSQLENGVPIFIRLVAVDEFGLDYGNYTSQLVGTPILNGATEELNAFKTISLGNNSAFTSEGCHMAIDPYGNMGVPGIRVGSNNADGKYLEFSEQVPGAVTLKLGKEVQFLGTDSYNNNALYDNWVNTPSSLSELSTVSAGQTFLHSSSAYTVVQLGGNAGSTYVVSRGLSVSLDTLSWSKTKYLRFALRPASISPNSVTRFVLGDVNPLGDGIYVGFKFTDIGGPLKISVVYNPDNSGEIEVGLFGISYFVGDTHIYEVICDVDLGTMVLKRNGTIMHTFNVNSNTFTGSQTRLWTIAMSKNAAAASTLNIGQVKSLQSE